MDGKAHDFDIDDEGELVLIDAPTLGTVTVLERGMVIAVITQEADGWAVQMFGSASKEVMMLIMQAMKDLMTGELRLQ